jgi:hypothetical protein
VKRTLNTGKCLPMAAMLLTMTIAGPATAGTQVPFSGSVHGQETDLFQGNPPNQILVDGNLTGLATHLGRLTLTYQVTVSLPAGSSTGSAQLVAANGDMIFTTIVGQGEPVPGTPGVSRIVEINTITGGTGRFAGAKGSFTLERLIDLGTGLTSGSFHGTITSPGEAH